jgi:short-chain fatty acids transporter
MNFLFFTLSLLLSQNPMEFSSRFKKAFVESSGIALQFPFYAGLMGLMEGSGLIKISSDFIISFSDSSSLPVFSFLSAGLVNIFVPSGGGQWVVQGPILLEASKILEVNPAKMAMAIAWGDAWTNLIQPFWAIPILSLAGLKLKDILGYCLVYFMASGIIILGFFCWF